MDKNDFEIRVPMQLLTAKIPAWVKLVWIAIRSFQGRNSYCFASLKTIGERVPNERGNPLDKGQVSRAVKRLVDTGFLQVDGRKKLRCVTPENVVAESTLSAGEAAEKLQLSQRFVVAESTERCSSVNSILKPKLKPKTKTKKKKAKAKKESPPFVRPTTEEIEDYFLQKQNELQILFPARLEAEAFIDYYDENDWRVTKQRTPMKSWERAARNWIRNIQRYGTTTTTRGGTGDRRDVHGTKAGSSSKMHNSFPNGSGMVQGKQPRPGAGSKLEALFHGGINPKDFELPGEDEPDRRLLPPSEASNQGASNESSF